jgi:hypothetical protein
VLAQLKTLRLAPTCASRGLSALIPALRSAFLALVVAPILSAQLRLQVERAVEPTRGELVLPPVDIWVTAPQGSFVYQVAAGSAKIERELTASIVRPALVHSRESGQERPPSSAPSATPGVTPGWGSLLPALVRNEIRCGRKIQSRRAPECAAISARHSADLRARLMT